MGWRGPCEASLLQPNEPPPTPQNKKGCAAVNTTAPCGNVAPRSPSPGPVTPAPTPSPTTAEQRTVECGVVLEPSISNWAMGQCG